MLLTVLILFVFLGSSVWVFFDATKLGAKPGKGIFDASPQIWLIGCFLFWFLVFPIYLIRRPKLVAEQKSSN